MNEIIKNMTTRKSIRIFQKKRVPKEQIEEILIAAKHAPTGRNTQYRRYTILREASMERLRKAMGTVLGSDQYGFFDCDTLIVVSIRRDWHLKELDTATALQNMMLAAHSLGLGSCWINQLRDKCDEPLIREVLHSFEIPENHVVYGMLALGYADHEPKEKNRVEEAFYFD